MPYLHANIDRAIVMTQYDLRGFAHPVFGRHKGVISPKNLDAITRNLLAFAVGLGHESGGPTDESWVRYRGDASFEDRLAMCQRLHEDCDESMREAIQLIVVDIVRKSEELKAEVAAGTRNESAYLKPLDKSSCWGQTILALAEIFEVELEEQAA